MQIHQKYIAAKPRKGTSARTYVLYERADGTPTSYWRNEHKPLVPGVLEDRRYSGEYSPPRFRWVTRAVSAAQARFFTAQSVTSASRSDGLGVWWDRDEHGFGATYTAPPLAADNTIYNALISECAGVRTITLWHSPENLQRAKDMIDTYGCGGICCGEHLVELMTEAEAERLRPEWYTIDDEPAFASAGAQA